MSPVASRLARAALVVAAVAGGAARHARAEPASEAVDRPRVLYLEILGKGALYGLGFDLQPGRAWSIGAAGSVFVVRGESVATLSPYVGLYPLGHGRHRAVVHLGAMLARRWIPAVVPELPGSVDGGVAAQVAAGYERRGSVVARLLGMATIGRGGPRPWLGITIGWSF